MNKQKLSVLTGISPDAKKYKSCTDFILSRCPIGIEIEMEDMPKPVRELGSNPDEVAPPQREPAFIDPRRRRPPTVGGGGNNLGNYWKVIGDGSLRNSGVEFISDPIWGEDINNALDTMQKLVEQSGNTPSFSKRTSVHIHLDVRTLDTVQLFNLLALVIIFERSLVEYCGGVREENIFCLPFYKAGASLKDLARIVDGDSDFIRVIDATFKYSGFNIRPISKQGSVEFRYHYGTMNKERLKEWINIIYCLKREATKVEDILNLPNLISQIGPEAYVKRVFGKFAHKLNTTTINEDIYEGVRLAQEVIYADRQKIIKPRAIKYTRINKVAKANKKKALVPPVSDVPSTYMYGNAVTEVIMDRAVADIELDEQLQRLREILGN